MKLPSILTPVASRISMPAPEKALITSPRTVTLELSMLSPLVPACPALDPSSSMSNFASVPTSRVFSVAPGWE